MFKIASISILLVVVTGCVSTKSSVIPKGYSGGKATIIDTYKRTSRATANFYIASMINEEKVANALSHSASISYGQNYNLSLTGQTKTIPTTSAVKVHIIGRAFNVVPIATLFSSEKEYLVQGEVSFTPKDNQVYLVKGILRYGYSAIWIEDEFGNIVSDIIKKGKEKPLYALTNKDYRSQTPIEVFNSLMGGETLNLVNKKLGQPVSLTPYINEKNLSTFKYSGIGSVQFTGDKKSGYYVVATLPIIGHTKEEIENIKRRLSTDHGGQLKRTVLDYYERDLSNTEALDLFAQKLWDSKNADHRNAVDAMSWICKMLAKSGDNRYYDLLAKVSTESTESKLRKYAKKSLAKLSSGDSNVFTPIE